MMHKSIVFQSYLYFVIYLVFILMFSCSRGPQRSIPEVSHIEIDSIQIERFDWDLQQINEQNIGPIHQNMKQSYGNFYKDYIEQILKIGAVVDDVHMEAVLPAISGQAEFQKLADTIDRIFPDLRQQERELTDAFKRIRYYLPEAPIPARFIAFFSGFAVQIPIGDDYMGIGLDLFLGADSEYYPELVQSFPQYISRRFSPENITPRVVEAYLRNELLPPEPASGTFLDMMLYQGKALYLMDLFLPHTPDSLKIGYTERQQAWVVHFQRHVWEWMTEEEMLFQRGGGLKQRHFGEAPFTPELGEKNDSAPKLGAFMGWQMVRKYMDRHTQTSLRELLDQTDSQKFLQDAKYRGDYQIL